MRKKYERIFPDEGLKEPVRPYSETFSAVTVIKEMFPEAFGIKKEK